jgi:hypothetical protein
VHAGERVKLGDIEIAATVGDELFERRDQGAQLAELRPSDSTNHA